LYRYTEVFLGGKANETLDVYSLSIIAYELLTRQVFLIGMRKKGDGYTCDYTGDEWVGLSLHSRMLMVTCY
jgi:hypothetical protein